MYCINCGVKLEDSESKCPLCQTTVYHPDIQRPKGEKNYPNYAKQTDEIRPEGAMFVVTMLFLLPVCITLLCDWRINGEITWSGYVAGGLALGYIIAALPAWFRKPNPVIFVPVNFAAVMLYILYINIFTGGHWFLSFAFPVVGTLGIIVTAVVALVKYVKKGYMYILGGASLALAGLAVLTEFLVTVTFGVKNMFVWSIYPLAAFVIIGVMLLIIAICKPLKESLYRKFFF